MHGLNLIELYTSLGEIWGLYSSLGRHVLANSSTVSVMSTIVNINMWVNRVFSLGTSGQIYILFIY